MQERMFLDVVRGREGEVVSLFSDESTFAFPLRRSLMSCSIGDSESSLSVKDWLLLPANVAASMRARSSTFELVVLRPSPSLLDDAVRQYVPHIVKDDLLRTLRVATSLPRTTWVNEIVHRYVFERRVCERHNNAATAFLEVELIKEWFFVRKDSEAAEPSRESFLHGELVLVTAAREFAEAHLSEKLTLASIAKAIGTSPRSLSRAFQKELKISPMEWVRTRRLDEAMLLLQTGGVDVSEVATRTGYESLSAFSFAFRRRYQKTPRAVTR